MNSSSLAMPDNPDRRALQAGIELADEGVLLLDGKSRIIVGNGLARELMRVASPRIEGIDFWDLLADQTIQKHLNATHRALKAAKTYTFTEHDPFEKRWIEYRVSSRPLGIVVTVREVTDRHQLLSVLRESEQRNSGLFEVNPNIMWVFDLDSLKVLAANHASLAFYGYEREAFLALHLGALYAEGEQAEFKGGERGGSAGLPQDASVLCKHRNRSGRSMLVEVTGHPLEWMGLNAMLVTAVDVTERQAANASLRRQNVMLQSKLDLLASDLKKVQDEHNSFNYALSHDLQSPLHVVDGFAKTLVARYSESLDAQGLHFLQRIEASVQKMAKLIDDLRLLSRIPRLAMNVQSVDLAPICTVIMERLRKDDPGRVTELEMPDRVEVWGDKTLLATALGCLLENAWKFTARKPQAWIKIGLTHTPGSNDDVLSVLDNGAGFDSAYTHKLFVPFQRLHSSADFPGTGLGLAIVKKIAERHGGTVSAESADSAGANVFMRMPRMDAATTSLSVR